MIPIDYAKEFATAINDSKLAIMDDCGHIPYEEKPKEFSELVLEFLAEREAVSASQGLLVAFDSFSMSV